MEMNLREETRGFNRNSRLVQKNGFETYTKTEKEESLPPRNEIRKIVFFFFGLSSINFQKVFSFL